MAGGTWERMCRASRPYSPGGSGAPPSHLPFSQIPGTQLGVAPLKQAFLPSGSSGGGGVSKDTRNSCKDMVTSSGLNEKSTPFHPFRDGIPFAEMWKDAASNLCVCVCVWFPHHLHHLLWKIFSPFHLKIFFFLPSKVCRFMAEDWKSRHVTQKTLKFISNLIS